MYFIFALMKKCTLKEWEGDVLCSGSRGDELPSVESSVRWEGRPCTCHWIRPSDHPSGAHVWHLRGLLYKSVPQRLILVVDMLLLFLILSSHCFAGTLWFHCFWSRKVRRQGGWKISLATWEKEGDWVHVFVPREADFNRLWHTNQMDEGVCSLGHGLSNALKFSILWRLSFAFLGALVNLVYKKWILWSCCGSHFEFV